MEKHSPIGWTKALEKRLYDFLMKIEVNNLGMFSDSLESQSKEILRQIHSAKKEYLSTYDPLFIFSKYIQSKFSNLEKDQQTADRISNLFGDENVRAYAKELAEYFNSIPRKYSLFVELPSLFNEGIGNAGLSKSVVAIECDGEERQASTKKPITLADLARGENIRSLDELEEINSGFFSK